MDNTSTTKKKDLEEWSLDKRIRLKISRNLSFFLLYKSIKAGSTFLRDNICKFIMPRPISAKYICPTLYNVKVLVDPINGKGLESSLYYFGEYESGMLFIFKRFLSKNDIVLDVGANIGFISLVVANFVGDGGLVYAFEPHPEIYQILEENIDINSLKNICPMNIALGSKLSKAKIYEHLNINRASASLFRTKNIDEEESKWQTKVTTIDLLIEKRKIKIPKLIKIDVEGFELEVIKGAKKLLSSQRAPALCIEFSILHPIYGGNIHDVYNFIKEVNNYHLFRLKRGKGIPSKLIEINSENELTYHDNVFCFLENHL
jgi:FkbM family methyltransferase